ncbi:WXG100 family type VII secretion target [Mycolicibacterium thermoresistibile]|nr:WXG100 family type VII secretion target [Mycolicibacterium thermoresistibile]MCV7191180.1 WXG100 family type VII secretion target [Mycolicibacterium thermoresistibile]GAT17635.1 putative uncharacterized protein [Mycolicibacterium thermoresistibile]
MPQPLKVDPSQLRLQAARLDVASAEAIAKLSANMVAMAGCQMGWKGTALAAFERLRDSWELSDTARATRLEDIALNLHSAANVYEQQDETSGESIDRSI